MPEMTRGEFMELLQRKCAFPNKEGVLTWFQYFLFGIPSSTIGSVTMPGKDPEQDVFLAHRDRDLPEMIERCESYGLGAIVDRRLNVIIGVKAGVHEVFRARLHAYYSGLSFQELRDYEECATSWLMESCGYYMSTSWLGQIIVGPNFRPDRFDRDLFTTKHIRTQHT